MHSFDCQVNKKCQRKPLYTCGKNVGGVCQGRTTRIKVRGYEEIHIQLWSENMKSRFALGKSNIGGSEQSPG
jgi:hypothetical protein